MNLDTASKGIGTGIGVAAMGIGLGIAFDAVRDVKQTKKKVMSMPSFEPIKFRKFKW